MANQAHELNLLGHSPLIVLLELLLDSSVLSRLNLIAELFDVSKFPKFGLYSFQLKKLCINFVLVVLSIIEHFDSF